MKRWIPFLKSGPTVAVLRLQGAIGMGGSRGLSDRSMAATIEKAFAKGKPDAVALEISSPGGSPVQSSLIAARIRRLAAEKDVPVYAFVEDLAASGGYWLACAADEIYVDQSSILGSIGVISSGFGLTGAIEKLGIERRVHTAGKSKSRLDPFQPQKPADVKQLRALLEQVHEVFKAYVSDRRAGKLPEDQDLFTGDIWLGQQAIDVGLADGLGMLVPVMKEKLGDDVRFRRYGPKRPLVSRIGAQIVDDAYAGIEERAAYARFGL